MDVTSMNGRLYGISVGPGDWKMMTLRAREILENSRIICFPSKKEGGSSFALSIVQQAVDTSGKRLEEIVFSMDPDDSVRAESQRKAIDRICEFLSEGYDVPLITIGDIGVYSTYMYVDRAVRERGFDTEVVPGISSFTYGASRARLPLMIDDETLCVVPMARGNRGRLERAIAENDNIVIMKAYDSLPMIAEMMKNAGIPAEKATVMCNVGTEDEFIGPLDPDMKCGYFTTVLIKK